MKFLHSKFDQLVVRGVRGWWHPWFLLNFLLALTATLIVVQILAFGPVAFQKANLITIEALALSKHPLHDSAVNSIIAQIPALPKDGMNVFFEVSPRDKWQRVLTTGQGDCSHLSFGLAYRLRELKVEYEIVHLLPLREFLEGDGHTVIATPYTFREVHNFALVDLLEGGIPLNASGRQAVTQDLVNHNMSAFGELISYRDGKAVTSKYYTTNYLSNAAFGRVLSSEVADYFDFMELIYFDIGSRPIQKYVFDGISLIFGKLPKIYVSESDFYRLFKEDDSRKLTRYVQIGNLMALRAILAGLCISMLVWCSRPLVYIFHLIRERRRLLRPR